MTDEENKTFFFYHRRIDLDTKIEEKRMKDRYINNPLHLFEHRNFDQIFVKQLQGTEGELVKS